MRRVLVTLLASLGEWAGGLPGMASAAVVLRAQPGLSPRTGGTARATVGVAVNDAVAQSGEDTVRIWRWQLHAIYGRQ